tara:strand:+ start:495 stop:605 length:111 start_codon:yes stop_codon:yes gene_type:complete
LPELKEEKSNSIFDLSSNSITVNGILLTFCPSRHAG